MKTDAGGTEIKLTGKTLGEACPHLFGANLEWISDVPQAISSERLRNPTFNGPADPGSGLAPCWKKMMEFGGGHTFALEPGHNRTGGPGQRLQVTHGDAWLVQPGCWVRAGERLRIRVWARCQGAPVSLRVGFRHRGLAGPIYGDAEILVDRSHFSLYEREIRISATDSNCLFFCRLNQAGIVYFDRMSACPADGHACRLDTVEAMRELAIADLRWPGGCLASGYHWQRGVGPEDERHDDADPTFRWGLCYTWGTDEYLGLCLQLGIRPHITVNIGTGTPREAAEWAAFCADWYLQRGTEPPEMVWQIGNEHYGSHEIGHQSGEQYAATLAAFAPGIRQAYPRAIICTTSLGEKPLEYVKPLLATAREHADIIPVHHYACRVDFNPAREALAFVGDTHTYARQLDELAAMVAESGSRAMLAVTEWGAFRSETHTDAKFCEPLHAGTVLFDAAILNEYCRRGRFLKLANCYSLLNFMPAIIARGPQVERTLRHAILRFWRPLFPATIQEVVVEGPVFAVPESKNDPTEVEPDLRDGSGDREAAEKSSRAGRPAVLLPWIDALAGTNDAGHWLLLTNRHPTETLTVQLPPEYTGATVDRLLPSADRLRFELKEGAATAVDTLSLPPCSHARLLKQDCQHA